MDCDQLESDTSMEDDVKISVDFGVLCNYYGYNGGD